MNDYLPKGELDPERDPKKPSANRIAIWVVVAAIGLYFIGSGLWGMLTPG